MVKVLSCVVVMFAYLQIGFAQAVLFESPNQSGQQVSVPLGATPLNLPFAKVQSVQLENNSVLILYEKYNQGRISGRYKLITSGNDNLPTNYQPKYATVFQDADDMVIGFSEPYFGGEKMSFKMGRNEVPSSFKMSSIYIPKGLHVKLYKEDPEKYNQEIENRPMGEGIRPFIGLDMAQKVKFVYIY